MTALIDRNAHMQYNTTHFMYAFMYSAIIATMNVKGKIRHAIYASTRCPSRPENNDFAFRPRKRRIRIGYTEKDRPQAAIPQSYNSTNLCSHNTINPLRNEVAREAKCKEASGNAPEPGQIALVLLARHPDVHTPHTSDDVHGQDDGTKDGEFAENIGGLLGALVHSDVDLGEVVAVGAGEEAVRSQLVICALTFVEWARLMLTSRSDSGCLSW
jgi:hypothetical protein